jgi:hypothetical protein
MLQLLTPTGGRPVAWALAERWAAHQTYAGPVRWIIVDDCDPPQPITFSRRGWTLQIVRPQTHWTPGENTQARNLLAGLDAVDSAYPVAVWEDDDYYAPGWLDTLAEHLERAELVGADRITYYNLTSRRWQRMKNLAHAAMSCTALRGAAITTLRRMATPGSTFIDARLWAAHPSRYLFNSRQVVSLKGLPGRPGIGRGHHDTFGREQDHDGSVLRHLLGPDADAYTQHVLPLLAVA